jgi:hypothetical protein
VGFVVDEVALGQVFSKYFCFPCQFSFDRLVHIHHLSSGAGTIGQLVADVPSGLSLTPSQETKKKLVEAFVTLEMKEKRGFSVVEDAVRVFINIVLNLKDDFFNNCITLWRT